MANGPKPPDDRPLDDTERDLWIRMGYSYGYRAYDIEIPDLKLGLAQVKTEVDGFVADSSRRHNELGQRLDDMEGDVKTIRTWMDQQTGKMVILVAIAAFLSSLLAGVVMWQLTGSP